MFPKGGGALALTTNRDCAAGDGKMDRFLMKMDPKMDPVRVKMLKISQFFCYKVLKLQKVDPVRTKKLQNPNLILEICDFGSRQRFPG